MEAAIRDARNREIEAQRERALRALLARPLMRPDDPSYPLVRAHADYLRTWLAREAGWSLRVEREYARLFKRPAHTTDATRGMSAYDRNRYILLCLALAVLEREDVQITLQRLGERLISEATEPALANTGFVFTLERQAQRRDLVTVCRSLLQLGVISRVAGDEEAYIHSAGDALYDIHRPVASVLLAGTRGPSTMREAADFNERLQALIEDSRLEGEEAERTAMRHRLTRRLLDEPVVYFDELPEDEREYFTNQRGAMARRLTEATGLTAEHQAEGTALVDESGELTDVALPKQGTDAHATLLVADFLAKRLRSGDDTPVPRAEIAAFVREAAESHRKYWRKNAREPGAERALADTSLQRLEALRLVQLGAETVQPLAAICRFRLGEAEIKQTNLFGDP